MPAAAPAATVNFTVEEPAPLMSAGLKLNATPAGWPEADSAMAEVKPPDAALLMLTVPAEPAPMEMAAAALSE